MGGLKPFAGFQTLHFSSERVGYSGEDVSMKATLSEAIIVEEDVSSGALIMSPGTATPLKLYLCTPIFVH
jgi:hypothetical protein